MADPLSIAVSALAIITATIQTTKSLYDTVQRFNKRNKTLRRLLQEIEDLTNILELLEQVIGAESSMIKLLQGPVEHCSQICTEFERSLAGFVGKSKTGLLDWTKLEFKRGDINEFIDVISGYKATISVGLATINLQTSKISQQALEKFNELIEDTSDELKILRQHIDEKLTRLTVEKYDISDISIDLEDEKKVTEQCLRICEEAKEYFESLSKSSLLQEVPRDAVDDYLQQSFEAQLLTRQLVNGSRDSITLMIGQIQKRLASLFQGNSSEHERDRLKLQEDLKIFQQCTEICNAATKVSHQKIYRVGEAIADENSDHVLVTTLADLFDVKKASSTGNSALLIASMTDESLRHTMEHRYKSRFGAVSGTSDYTEAGATSSPSTFEDQGQTYASLPRPGGEEQPSGRTARQNKPTPNEMRKRASGGAKE